MYSFLTFCWIALCLVARPLLAEEPALSPELQEKIDTLQKELDDLKKVATEKLQKRQKDNRESQQPLAQKAVKPATKTFAKQKNQAATEPSAALDTPSSEPAAPADAAGDSTTGKDFTQADQLYTRAQIALNQRKIDKAKVMLEELCRKYPDAPQFMLAKYWLGEINLEKRDFVSASIAYGSSYSTYKKALQNQETPPDIVKFKAQESLVKLAYCLKMLKKRQDACLSLQQMHKEFKPLPRNLKTYASYIETELKCKKN